MSATGHPALEDIASAVKKQYWSTTIKNIKKKLTNHNHFNDSVLNSGRPIYRQGRYIVRYLTYFKYRHRLISYSVWPICSRTILLFWRWREQQCLRTQRSHSPYSMFAVELLNKLIKRYTKKYYNNCLNIISNRKANSIILYRLLSVYRKCAFI